MAAQIPRVLAIAGSDSSGAAGVQADLKTFAARGVYGMSALTLVTAQNSLGIHGLQTLPPEFVAAQIDAVLSDIGADAVKTGLLHTTEIIQVVSAKTRQYAITNLIVDPVLIAGDGRRLVSNEALDAYRKDLFPHALIVTPNLREAAILSEADITNRDEMRTAAQAIHALGPRYVLVKGGDLPGETILDLLYDGERFYEFTIARVAAQVNPRGVGCAFASSIAAEVAKGHAVPEAVEISQKYVEGALRAAAGWKMGAGRGTAYHGFEHDEL